MYEIYIITNYEEKQNKENGFLHELRAKLVVHDEYFRVRDDAFS